MPRTSRVRESPNDASYLRLVSPLAWLLEDKGVWVHVATRFALRTRLPSPTSAQFPHCNVKLESARAFLKHQSKQEHSASLLRLTVFLLKLRLEAYKSTRYALRINSADGCARLMMALVRKRTYTTATSDTHEDTSQNNETNIFDLPQEVRDMIYAYFPYLASIHINQDPSKVVQPNISKASRQMRKESLDVFYGRNKFFLDLRGWKDSSYPRKWTPRMIFEHWVAAIGDENAARLRSLSFFSHNFRANIRISPERPPTLALIFRTNPMKADVAEGTPNWYTFAVAAQRVEKGLQRVIDEVQAKVLKRPLNVCDVSMIASTVDAVQPFLCTRMTLGQQGARLLKDDLEIKDWPSTLAHLDKCDDCGYHRYTRPNGD